MNFRDYQILFSNLFLFLSGWEEWGAFPQFKKDPAQSSNRGFEHTPE